MNYIFSVAFMANMLSMTTMLILFSMAGYVSTQINILFGTLFLIYLANKFLLYWYERKHTIGFSYAFIK